MMNDRPSIRKVDEKAIAERLEELAKKRSSSRYDRQKSALEEELKSFLANRAVPKSMASALPSDVVAFLVWKDKGGRTCVHKSGCEPSKSGGCNCPKRLAFGTVDALIGKLRAIFAAHERGTEWQPLLGVGNPAAGRVVKNFLADVRNEQIRARVVHHQADPVLLSDVEQISKYILAKLASPQRTEPSHIFVWARDQAVFKVLFFSGDRAADLLELKITDILRFPDNSGLLLNHVWTKTLRSGDSHVLALRRGTNKHICPVVGLELYVRLCSLVVINLGSGYIFRPLSKAGKVADRRLDTAAIQSRLDHYAAELRGRLSGARFTLHGFHSGSAVSVVGQRFP